MTPGLGEPCWPVDMPPQGREPAHTQALSTSSTESHQSPAKDMAVITDPNGNQLVCMLPFSPSYRDSLPASRLFPLEVSFLRTQDMLRDCALELGAPFQLSVNDMS